MSNLHCLIKEEKGDEIFFRNDTIFQAKDEKKDLKNKQSGNGCRSLVSKIV